MVKDRVIGNIFGAKEPYYRSSDDHDTARKRFEVLRTEYEYIMQLDHLHILRAYDLVLAEDVILPPWMIVEYIPLNLLEVLPDLNERQKLTVLTHLSSALQHMHENGMTHRDVKPHNILIQKRDQDLIVKLADFGTSTRNAKGKMATFTGTEIYMAPELFKKPRYYTNKVDMWSLGLVAMQLFTVWSPDLDEDWDPNDFGPWMRNVILPNRAEAPQQLCSLLNGLLRKKPELRWSAWKSLKWLWKHTQVDDDADDGGPVNHKKRSASILDEDSLQVANDNERRRRSPNPSVSTARTRAILSTEHPTDGRGRLPDTLSPGVWEPEVFSAAPTPHPDDDHSDDEEVDVEDGPSDGSDTELENDWQDGH